MISYFIFSIKMHFVSKNFNFNALKVDLKANNKINYAQIKSVISKISKHCHSIYLVYMTWFYISD